MTQKPSSAILCYNNWLPVRERSHSPVSMCERERLLHYHSPCSKPAPYYHIPDARTTNHIRPANHSLPLQHAISCRVALAARTPKYNHKGKNLSPQQAHPHLSQRSIRKAPHVCNDNDTLQHDAGHYPYNSL